MMATSPEVRSSVGVGVWACGRGRVGVWACGRGRGRVGVGVLESFRCAVTLCVCVTI